MPTGNKGRTENLRPFKPGQSGNPTGRPKGVSFASVIATRLEEMREGKTTREGIVEAAVGKALTGDMGAIQWIVDRVDGKLTDKSETTGELIVRVLRDRR